uniref:Afifavidin n=2 Tax=Afifella pfennigii TaxID=209897 RepID=UPI000F41F3B9|nr:Chain A, Afifavidin [Afifella pfennigii]6HDV_B Chain B, Afifavidin [Afifella pfennigii]6HDV_C Chain C, Afifavidin [Afifella pfennigii]6HDV_D Chain D, Afifavidin [Afifella pfennigii]
MAQDMSPRQSAEAFGVPAVSSSWVNQDGSTMTLVFGAGNSVSGFYVNNAPGFGCQGTPYPLVGLTWGNFIGFTVAWDNATANCNSVTSWTGFAEAAGSDVTIVTDWNLAYQGSSSGEIQQGSDTFTLVNKAMKETPKM